MNKNRLEAFSDGVIAIIITIMVLELKVPHEPTFAALSELAPVFLGYVNFYLRWHLLEQPSSPVADGQTGQRTDPVGESASVVLVVVDSVRNRVERREGGFAELPMAVYGFDSMDGGIRILHFGTSDDLASPGRSTLACESAMRNFKRYRFADWISVTIIWCVFNRSVSLRLYAAVAMRQFIQPSN
ncbi:MAG: TMEM175 family protein [Anaerolineales bacterium]